MKALFYLAAAVLAVLLAGCAPSAVTSGDRADDRPLITVFRHPT